MKKIALIFTLLAASLASQASIIVTTQTATDLDLSFELKDRFKLFGDTAAVETLNLTTFPGTSLSFYFRDGIIGLGGDQEGFSTVPSSGAFFFTQNNGSLDFAGSYNVGSTIVEWAVDSWVTTAILGNDTWKGRLTATARSVPDSGTTVALLGLGLLGLAAIRRKLA